MSTIMSTTPHKQRKQKADYYQIVTNRIIDLLDKGVAPWQKPFGSYGLAKNYASGHVYQGINMLMLNYIVPYDVPLYMSKKQIQDKGGRIKKGSKAQWVYFYGEYYKDGDGKTISATKAKEQEQKGAEVRCIRFLKTRPVYNISCVEGIEIEVPTMPVRENSVIDSCEDFLRDLHPRPDYDTVDTDKAYYDKDRDTIRIPDMKYFEGSEAFYSTLFHEIIHWTGHTSRLNRKGITNPDATFGTKLYAEEELVAEIGAAYLCNITGIDQESIVENSASYIQSWKSRLTEDKKLIFRTAAKAQQAINFLTKTQ